MRPPDPAVRFPLAGRPEECHDRIVVAGLRALLPGRAGQGRPLRRLVLHGRHLHRHLLPAELPSHHPQAGQCALLPDGRRGATRRLPGLQALPSRTPHPGRPSGTCGPMSSGAPCASSRTASSTVTASAASPHGSGTASATFIASSSAEVGAGPIALARAQRAQTARILIETTDLPVRAGGLRRRLRQHPSVQRHRPRGVRHHSDRAPRQGEAARPSTIDPGRRSRRRRAASRLRLAVRQPFDGDGLLAFLGPRAVPGDRGAGRRHLPADAAPPHGPAVIDLTPAPDHVRCAVRLPRPARPGQRGAAGPEAARPRRRSHCRQRRAGAPTSSWLPSWPSHPGGARLVMSMAPSWPSRAVFGTAGVGRGRPHAHRPARHGRRHPAGSAPDGGLTHLFPAPGRRRRRSIRRCWPCRRAAGAPSSGWPAALAGGRSPSTRAPTGRALERNSPGCPESARGPRPTSPCAAWATRMCSCPATWACAAPSSASASPPIRAMRRPGRRRGVPGVPMPSTTCGPASLTVQPPIALKGPSMTT